MRKVISFQNRLFLAYTLFVTVVIFLIFLSIYWYFQNHLKQNSEGLFAQSARQILFNLDSSIEALDTVATQVVSSQTVQDGLTRSNLQTGNLNNFFDYHLADKNAITSFLRSVNGPKETAQRISVIDNDYNFVTFGKKLSPMNKAKLRNTDIPFPKTSTAFVLTSPHRNIWSNQDDDLVITLIRQIRGLDSGFEPLGIVEVVQSYSTIELVGKTVSEMSVIVLDQDANVVHPIHDATRNDALRYLEQLTGQEPGKIFTLTDSSDDTQITTYLTSDYTGYTVILMQPEDEFLKPILVLRNYLLLFCALLIIIAIIFSHAITRSVTSPIRKLKSAILSGTFENQHFRLNLDKETSPVINELDLLNRAFVKMVDRLNQTASEIIHARTSETEAHFLALQAQMNPHFLYNSLMCISSAGQEAGSHKVQMMCAQLSQLLRYIISKDDKLITLADEIRHTELYLEFIKWRYEDRFNYTMDIDPRLHEVNVPKLILQPLIENCFDHGFVKRRAPWHITVKGFYISAEHWYVSVTDNGDGFDYDALQDLERRMAVLDREMRSGQLDNRFEIDRMGLMNIYFRMKLLYKSHAVFRITNHEDEGASVVLGLHCSGERMQ